jgi:hypothetical protein
MTKTKVAAMPPPEPEESIETSKDNGLKAWVCLSPGGRLPQGQQYMGICPQRGIHLEPSDKTI